MAPSISNTFIMNWYEPAELFNAIRTGLSDMLVTVNYQGKAFRKSTYTCFQVMQEIGFHTKRIWCGVFVHNRYGNRRQEEMQQKMRNRKENWDTKKSCTCPDKVYKHSLKEICVLKNPWIIKCHSLERFFFVDILHENVVKLFQEDNKVNHYLSHSPLHPTSQTIWPLLLSSYMRLTLSCWRLWIFSQYMS